MLTPMIKWIPVSLFTVLSTVYLGVRKQFTAVAVNTRNAIESMTITHVL